MGSQSTASVARMSEAISGNAAYFAPAYRYARAGYVAPTDLPAGRRQQKPRQSPAQKIFRFSKNRNQSYIPAVPFRSEGRVANVTKRETECDWPRLSSLGEAMFEAVLLASCGCGINRGLCW
jgi:hypothetical protein